MISNWLLDKKKDLNKAFKTYIDAAENNNDTFAMFRLYHYFLFDSLVDIY